MLYDLLVSGREQLVLLMCIRGRIDLFTLSLPLV